jgi:AraC-like DNA-binding protein
MQNTLRYDYTGDGRFLEGADWFGCRPAGLQLHFHDEAQVSVIWNGYRDYRIGPKQVRLYPGQLLIIPELRPHLALPSMHDEVRSVEFYLAPAALSLDTRLWLSNSDFAIIEAPFLKRLASCEVAELTVSCIADKIGSGRRPAPPISTPAKTALREVAAGNRGVSEAAGHLRYTREGFIRAFTREVGMTPNAYNINRRLNRARQLLRSGDSLSEISHETGFSDQSHFGRSFLRHFGATPGHFRAAHSLR